MPSLSLSNITSTYPMKYFYTSKIWTSPLLSRAHAPSTILNSIHVPIQQTPSFFSHDPNMIPSFYHHLNHHSPMSLSKKMIPSTPSTVSQMIPDALHHIVGMFVLGKLIAGFHDGLQHTRNARGLTSQGVNERVTFVFFGNTGRSIRDGGFRICI